MTAFVRPQPLGAFPLPAGFLLVPGDTDVRAELVAGRLPSQWPDELAGHRLAHAGRVDEALAHFSDSDPVGRYNRFVLAPDGVDVARVRAGLPDELAPLVDVVAYSVGLTDVLPEVGSADGEVAAIVTATLASVDLSNGLAAQAISRLREASALAGPSSPVLAGLLLGNAGMVAHDTGDPALLDAAIDDLRKGLQPLAETQLGTGRAELHLSLGMLLHEWAAGLGAAGAPITEAVANYHEVLGCVDAESAPYVWASAHLNLATAYLTAPMVEASDALRNGIAVQSLRAALEVFTQQEYPQQWAAATVNLANALIYQPSKKQGDNLVEAVERYEEVLAVRDAATDPLGVARLLTNQGNALAHLGIFDHAKAKLYEARALFEQQMDHDGAMTVRQVLDEIAKVSTSADQQVREGRAAGTAEKAVAL